MPTRYARLLSKKRDRKTSIRGRDLAIESESDRSRLVFSAPFRRLQQKAQVFSLEPNAAVRSRLTHSIEVAQVGRFLADQIVEKLSKSGAITPPEARSFINFVEVACLMHDLGNPPFGHFGEAAISEWFRENGGDLIQHVVGIPVNSTNEPIPQDVRMALADFVEFDGNCQGLRIASLLQWNDDEHGLNLTYTSLAAYLKYIRGPLFDSSEVKNKPFMKKAGFFQTERPLVERIWRHFGYSAALPQRFPLAYVMEAADDIAYCISDLEDSIEKGLLKQELVFSDLGREWSKIRKRKPEIGGAHAEAISELLRSASRSTKTDGYTFTAFRTNLSRRLTQIACEAYTRNHSKIHDGSSLGLIDERSAGGQVLAMLKDYCRKHVYQHESVQLTELAGLTAIRGLLGHFKVLLNCSEARFLAALKNENKDADGRAIIFEKKLLSLFPTKHIRAYEHGTSKLTSGKRGKIDRKLAEWHLRAHLVTDFISGMTDDFALSTFQTLSGIKVNT